MNVTGTDPWAAAARKFYPERLRRLFVPEVVTRFVRAYAPLRQRLGAADKILDAGCGSGFLADTLQDTAKQFVGADLIAESLQRASTLYPHARFCCADITKLPFLDQEFNAVTALSSLEFCQRKLEALREIYRVLKPGGKCYVEVRNSGFLLWALPAKLGLGRPAENYPAGGFRDLNPGEWQALFEGAGFKVAARYAALRPLNFGAGLLRLKHALIFLIQKLFPFERHFICAFLLERPQ